jgi:sec-independent protein translocase protein TatC
MSKLGDTVTGARVLGTRMAQLHRQSNPEGRMPLMDHLRELRNRVVKAAAALLVGTSIGLIPAVFDRVWHVVVRPFCTAAVHGQVGCHRSGATLVYTGVLDPFNQRVEIAFFFGLLVTCPIWLYQIWAFIAPGLYRRERRWTYVFVGTAAPLFLTGAVIAYFAMSRGLGFLLGLTPAGVSNYIQVSTYLSYFVAMILGFALAFELPLAMVMLNKVGILTHERFRKWRRIMIFLVFVFCGIASPSPDPLTMLLLAVPCVVLVEVAEVVIWATDRRRASRPSMYAGLSDDEVSPLDFDAAPHDGVDAGRSEFDA